MSVYIYNRSALIHKLKTVEPAFSKSDLFPALQQAYFTEGGLLASNDQIALATSLDFEVPDMGVDGLRFIKLLTTAVTDNIQLTMLDTYMRIDAKGFTAKLNTSHGEPPFRWPTPEETLPSVYISREMAVSLDVTRRVVNPQSDELHARGVTLVRKDGLVTLWATDSKSMIKHPFTHDWSDGEPLVVVLTMACVEMLSKLAPGWLRVAPEYVLFDTDDGDVSMWARVIRPTKWLTLQKMAGNIPAAVTLHPIPAGFGKLMKRSGVMLRSDADGQKPCKLILDGASLTITSTGPTGEVTASLPCEHDPVTVNIDQAMIARLWNKCEFDRMGASRTGFCLFAGDLAYLMAVPS